MKSRVLSAYSLRSPSGDRYSEGRKRPPSPTKVAIAKENEREGADQVPARQPLYRLPGRDHAGDGTEFSPGGRRAGGQAAPLKAHRGEGRRRHADHARRLLEGAHPERNQRDGRPRAAFHVLGELGTRLPSGGGRALGA